METVAQHRGADIRAGDNCVVRVNDRLVVKDGIDELIGQRTFQKGKIDPNRARSRTTSISPFLISASSPNRSMSSRLRLSKSST